MKLTQCTLNGLSADVELTKVHQLSMNYPIAEWGIAYRGPDYAGTGRYATLDWAVDFGVRGGRLGVRRVLQLRGEAVQGFLSLDADIHRLAKLYDRIQIHEVWGRLGATAADLDRAISALGRPVITPVRASGDDVASGIKAHYHEALLGPIATARGKQWPAPLPGKSRCGYGGGLGPDNIADELARIAQVTGDRPFWVVAESSLLDGDGRFELSKAEAMLAAVSACCGLTRGKPVAQTPVATRLTAAA